MTSSRGEAWTYTIAIYLLCAAAGGVLGAVVLTVLHRTSDHHGTLLLVMVVGVGCGAGAALAAETIANRRAMAARTAAFRAAYGQPVGNGQPQAAPRHASGGEAYPAAGGDLYPASGGDVYPAPTPPAQPTTPEVQPQPALSVPNYAVTPVEQPRPPRRVKPAASGWWEAEAAPSPSQRSEGRRRTAPDIGRYVRAGRIVQCTACADFAVDVVRVDYGFTFRCQACGHGFSWKPDADWPAWKVSPRSRSNS
jgi:hypothetical protein